MTSADDHRHPSRQAAAAFAIKSTLLKARRSAMDLLRPQVRPLPRTGASPESKLLSEVASALYTDNAPTERALQMGKVQNLRVAARALDGVAVGAGQVFSFWAQLGRPTRAKGYVAGRELRQGCLVPTVAGGLCQLSNSLYQAARRAGCEIVERHGHTAAIPNSPFRPGEDATVFWNYVDLRFRAPRPLIVRVRLTADQLLVALVAA